MSRVLLVVLTFVSLSTASAAASAAASAVETAPRVATAPIAELAPIASLKVGQTADWVAIAADAVWVGSTGPHAVHRIDPRTNKLVATVLLRGEPCAGLAVRRDHLWVPLCTQPASLAKVDLHSNWIAAVIGVGPAGEEGGVATSADSVWLVTDAQGSLARIDAVSGTLKQTVRVPPGSFNPLFSDGYIWITRAEGAEVTAVDAKTGAVVGTAQTGPNPRFLAAGDGAIWTLNQADGSLTRIDARSRKALSTIALGTPGRGGDIRVGGGFVWTTMRKVPLSAIDEKTTTLLCQWTGDGGDSLGIGHRSIWLTDYRGGTVSRYDLERTAKQCRRMAAALPRDAAKP